MPAQNPPPYRTPRIAPPALQPWFLTLNELSAPPFVWSEFFGNSGRVEVEIGSGRGLFLMSAAMLRPETNFLGIECDFKEARRAARRLQKRDLNNGRMIGADARIVLAKYVTSSSVDAAHVYFPDPWWKRRHRKRRIFNPEFINEMARILRSGGILHSWTDVPEYFEVIRKLVGNHPEFSELPPPPEHSPRHDMDYHTSFERKKRKLGLPIFRAQWIRRDWPTLPASESVPTTDPKTDR